MKAQKFLWNEGLNGNGSWWSDLVTNIAEFAIIDSEQANLPIYKERDRKMLCLFFALYFADTTTVNRIIEV